jgi:transcriptional regulator with XRE-family HTH domain
MQLTIEQIVEAGRVTPAYARMLHSGARYPSLSLALRLYDATGAKVGPLIGLGKAAIEAARRNEEARQAAKTKAA